MPLRRLKAVLFVSSVCGLMIASGCSSGSGTTAETGNRDAIAAPPAPASNAPVARQIGTYPTPPEVSRRPRIGVERFTVSAISGRMGQLDDVAADEATTLLDQWGGFKMIERAQMDQLFREQGLAGIDAGERATQHKIHGVDMMLIGKITNLSIKRDVTHSGFDIGGIGRTSQETKITSTCGIVLRLEDPSTGEIVASVNDDFDQVFSAESSGMNIMGVRTGGGSQVQISDDDRGKLLKMALDDAILKGIPKFERVLKEFNANPPTAQ